MTTTNTGGREERTMIRTSCPPPVIMSRPITAAVRAYALPLGTQTAAERAAALIRDDLLAQVEDALPGITPEDAAQFLKVAEHELGVTTHSDGSVSMSVSYKVTARRTE